MKPTSLLTLIIALILTGCATESENPSWADGMRGMSKAFEDLMPYIYNKSRFSDPNNKMFIKTKLNQLNHHSHSLDQHVASGLSGDDPLFKVGLKGLRRNINRASDSYFVESYDYSQLILQSSVNYCVECHTRTNRGRSFVFYDGFAKDPALKIEKIDFAKVQVATRQFTQALETLQTYIEDGKTKSDDAFSALEFMLTIAIRNQNSLDEAVKIIDQNMKVPHFKNQLEALKIWKSYLSPFLKSKKTLSLEQALLKNNSKQTTEQSFAESVHKSLILHQALSAVKEAPKRSEILLALGQIYENNQSIGFWELPDHYYEACIRENPYTDMAKKCYFTLEARLRSSYGLKGLESLPRLDQGHLLNLKPLTIKQTKTGAGGGDRF